MRARATDSGLLRRLEPLLSDVAAHPGPARLAFSGGIASLVLAALLRKRVDLECVVAGLAGARDLVVASEERLYLDYNITEVRLSAPKALSLARDLARRFPALSVREVLDAVPLQAVRARFPDGSVLAGLGTRPLPAATVAAASLLGFDLPLLSETASVAPSRGMLVAVARSLGLPEAFVRSRSRRPAVGSGVGAALRAVSLEKRVSVSRLLRA